MPEQKMQNSKSKIWILLVLVLVILLGVGGFFYWKNYLAKSNEQGGERSEPPRLFGKEDYRVEEREDGKYIVVDKVGLRAKVPEGWEVKFEGSDMPDGTSQKWVNLLSQDAEKKSGLLAKGCGISILTGTHKDSQDIQNAIKNINNGMDKIKETKPDFIFNIITVGRKEALESISPTRKIFGRAISVNIPIKENLLVLETRMPEGYENICLAIWETFLKNIDLK